MPILLYCDANELLSRYDSRRVAQLVSDDGVIPDVGDLTSNTNLLTALQDATAEVNSAVLIGKRYTVEQLDPLTLPQQLTENGYYLLKRITADIAFSYLVARRGQSSADTSMLGPRYQQSMEMIERLRQGHRIFNLVDESAAEAGLAHVTSVGIDSTFLNNSIVRHSFGYFGVLPVIKYNNYYG